MHLIYSDSGLLKKDSTPGIFLAGPSPRGYGKGYPKDWRDDAIKIFEELKFKGKYLYQDHQMDTWIITMVK